MFRCLLPSLWLILLALTLTGCKRNSSPSDPASDRFLSLMNAGKNYLDRGDTSNALEVYRQASTLNPNNVDVHLNLANVHLKSGAAAEALEEVARVLELEPNSAAAYFIAGSAHLRLSNAQEAVQSLENAKKIEPGEPSTFFQLGLARMAMEQWEEAIAAFREGLRLDPNRLHSTARYLLARSLLQAGRREEAQQELQLHQGGNEEEVPAMGAAIFEKCKYTKARVPFKLDQPELEGISVEFVDATVEVLGDAASHYSAPAAVIDADRAGRSSVFVLESNSGFRLLRNLQGVLQPDPTNYPAIAGATYTKMLVGDLQNDRWDDIIVLGNQGSHLFAFGTNGLAKDMTPASGLSGLTGVDAALMDLDFTGKLDLVAVTDKASDLQVFRQSSPLSFTNISMAAGVPDNLNDARSVTMADWNRDDVMDLIVTRAAGQPLLLEKQRGGPLAPRESTNWVEGATVCAGDFDNDLRPDLAVVSGRRLVVCYHGGERVEIALPSAARVDRLLAVDYDNDGWLDLWAIGDHLLAWRNRGTAGFEDQTTRLGLNRFKDSAIAEVHFADFDMDCDSDAIVALKVGGLRYLRNDGGNENAQVKVNLVGNRSNASGLGCKIEIETGGLRLIRTVRQLPVEVGVGKHRKLDSFLVHWFNWPQGSADMTVDCQEPLFALELTIQEGSCPYLYAWDGTGFRFVTDFLGAAPLGLPVAEGRFVEADPEEFIWIGDEQTILARDGSYRIQITEELREVLYLDEAKLVVVDRAPETEVHPTDKLLPGRPFPPGELMTLHREKPLQKAERLDGQDVTAALRAVDGSRVSPPRLRTPQLRGLAEPHGLILDFGSLDVQESLVLVMNGWLRFGGGMANIAASHDPSLPFPFPKLEMEVAPGLWKDVDVTVGAPAGKTKTILVDLMGKLQSGARRLRLTQAFEIHWDRIALMKSVATPQTRTTFLAPTEADLHFRGFSLPQDLSPDWPITPDYAAVRPNSYWTIVPEGWATRYGDVTELIAERDEGLALIHSGDELTLKFAVDSLPPKPKGSVREFFLYADGWDKDSDFHVAAGGQIEPLPFHGMNDQRYGHERRPSFPSDRLHRQYNTRWVEGRVLKQISAR